MSSVAVPVASSGSAQSWACKSCNQLNSAAVRVAAASTSVPCSHCGAFNNVAAGATAPQATSTASAVNAAAPGAAASNGIPVVQTRAPLSLDDSARVARFQRLLRMKTIANQGPVNGANAEAVAFLREVGEAMGLRAQVLTYTPNQPILLLTLEGSDPSLSSILLNSHYDVVPVMQDKWHCDPFAAEVTQDGKIYARGSQDMKVVCMAYLEALLSLLTGSSRVPEGRFRRTVHLSFMPDEETGGAFGMQLFVESPEFKALNVGFALDEGIANPNDEYTVFYGERGVWWMTVRAEGPTGHGSRFIKDPATQKLMRAVQHFLDYRDLQEARLLHGRPAHGAECAHAVAARLPLALGDVISVNLTVLKAGVSVDNGQSYSYNVIPMVAEAGFDLRLPPHVDLAEFEAKVREWTKEDGVSFTVRKFSAEQVTNIDEESNPFWRTFKSTLESSSSTKVVPQIFPAGTDSRFLRRALIPVIGFSPLNLTPVLLHDHNEYVTVDTFLNGVKVYEKLIPALANLEALPEPQRSAAPAEVTAEVQPGTMAHVYSQPKLPMDVLPEGAGRWSGSRAFPNGAESITAAMLDAANGGAASASAVPAAAASSAQTQTERPAHSSPIPTQTDAPAPAGEPRATQTEARPAQAGAGTQTEAAPQQA